MIHWNGKDYLRVGYCSNCGECCNLGTTAPCPHVENLPDYTSRCRIYARRADRDDPLALSIGILTTGCALFPRDPGDLNSDQIRNRCTYQFLECPKILVASCTHEVKEYAWDRWVAAVKSLTYPNLDVLVVDNSPDLAFYERHRHDGVELIHLDVQSADPIPGHNAALFRINASMEAIRQRFLAGPYDSWMNIESDVIVPPDIIEQLMLHCPMADWASHPYPIRNEMDDLKFEQGIGCSLLKRRIVEDFAFPADGGFGPDFALWDYVKQSRRFVVHETYGIAKIDHLAGPGWENG